MLWGWSHTDPMDGCAGCHSHAVAVYCHQGAMSQTTALWAAFACGAKIKSQLKPLSVLCSSLKHNSSKVKGSLQIHPHWAACLWFSGAPHTSILAKAVILHKVTQTHICKIGFTSISTLPEIISFGQRYICHSSAARAHTMFFFSLSRWLTIFNSPLALSSIYL